MTRKWEQLEIVVCARVFAFKSFEGDTSKTFNTNRNLINLSFFRFSNFHEKQLGAILEERMETPRGFFIRKYGTLNSR